jgi:hypothetical protein
VDWRGLAKLELEASYLNGDCQDIYISQYKSHWRVIPSKQAKQAKSHYSLQFVYTPFFTELHCI